MIGKKQCQNTLRKKVYQLFNIMNRREFIQLLTIASSTYPRFLTAKSENLYEIPINGHIRLLHITDCHAQLLPIYYREPHINLGVGPTRNQVPHRVGDQLLNYFNVPSDSPLAHALTPIHFVELAQKYGKVGGFAYLATLIKQLRDSYGREKTLLLDGGDTWQGSGTAYWTRGQDMVEACNLLGVDVMTGHWEFTYSAEEIVKNLKQFKGDFVAQNIFVKDESRFMDAPVADAEGHAFKPYTVRDLNGVSVAIIGQAFPYTPIANPARFIPDWTFGVRETELQTLVNALREKSAVVVLLSHNGMDVDLKMASRISGIDVILGGHTHDGVPKPVPVKNAGGRTLVCNAGSNGKFVGVLDLTLDKQRVKDYHYQLLPVFSNLLPADPKMQMYIEQVRAPYLEKLSEKLAVSEQLLFRRGNFNGPFDQLICDALRAHHDAQIALSPGFRWGTTVLPAEELTFETVLNQTAITYPETYRRELTGRALKDILEDVCDNLFNHDPYLQQGGDMVRVGGMNYVCDPNQEMGKRIQDLTLDDGTAIEGNKKYVVSGWATVSEPASGKPVWDVVAEYLRDLQTVKLTRLNTPKLLNIKDNFGIVDSGTF